jgi:hypothetical protein
MENSKEFHSIALWQFMNEDLFQVTCDVADTLYFDDGAHEDRQGKAYDVDTLGVRPKYLNLINARDKFGLVLEPILKSPVTRKLADADFFRDTITQGFNGQVNTMAKYHFDPAMHDFAPPSTPSASAPGS